MEMDKEEMLKMKIIAVLQTVFDPELPVNIYDLGLIYEINIRKESEVQIVMTLTAPGCPAAQTLPVEVDEKVRAMDEVSDVYVTVTWDPAWNKSMMSEVAQLELGFL